MTLQTKDANGVATSLTTPQLTQLQTDLGLQSAAFQPSTAFATAAQGALASTAVQPAALTAALPAAGSATPLQAGTGAAGASAAYSRQDHVHPSDTSRIATSAAGATGLTVLAAASQAAAQTAIGVSPILDPVSGKLSSAYRTMLQTAGVFTIPTSGLNGADYGLVPDTGADLTSQLQAALTAGRTTGLPVFVEPGKYIYKNLIEGAGGGLICPAGQAWFDNQDPAYTNVRIHFLNPDNVSYLENITIYGCKFTVSTRPDTGLANNAVENTGFLSFEKCRNVKVLNNEFSHNWGGCVLFRWVEDSIIANNYVFDVWKDCFHITGGSRNIVRAFNIVRGCGDDAFPVVGYVTHGVKPVGILDIGNRVYGVRTGRGFAYVGSSEVTNVGNYVDGRTPALIPQKTNAAGDILNTPCALYISSESGFNSYGNDNITVTGFVGEYLASPINTAGAVSSTLSNATLQAIHLASGNGANYPAKNIKVQATLRNIAARGFFASGNGYMQDVEADIIVEDNTDPAGLTSLTATPNAGLTATNAAEFQGVRNIKLKLRCNKIASNAAYFDANCSGTLDLDINSGSVCQFLTNQNFVTIAASSKLDAVDIRINFEVSPTASGVGQINRIVELAGNTGLVRSTRITGVDCGLGAANRLSGWPSRALTFSASPATVLNPNSTQKMISTVGGAVTSVTRSTVTARVAAQAVTSGANGTVTVVGDVTDLYVAAKVATLFNSRSVSIGTATVASSAYTASSNTTVVTFDATGVAAAFAPGMQMAILGTAKTLTGRTSGIFDLPIESAITFTYTTAPTNPGLLEQVA